MPPKIIHRAAPRTAGLAGVGDRAPQFIRRLKQDVEARLAGPHAGTITNATCRHAAEWLVQQSAAVQGETLHELFVYRPQHVHGIVDHYHRVLVGMRRAASRLKASDPGSLILSRNGTIMG